MAKQTYRIAEFTQAFGVGRSTIYTLITKGRLDILKSGRLTLITSESVERWLAESRAEARRERLPVGKRRGTAA